MEQKEGGWQRKVARSKCPVMYWKTVKAHDCESSDADADAQKFWRRCFNCCRLTFSSGIDAVSYSLGVPACALSHLNFVCDILPANVH